MKQAPTMTVGMIAATNSPSGETPPSPNSLPKIACPTGFGAFAITVNPPPVTAPAMTAYFNSAEKFGTNDAR
jgi:hypothetical protein